MGKLTCCEKLKQFNSSRNSVADLQLMLSMWKLKSPRMTTEGDIAQSWVRKCEKSERKVGFGLEGAVDNGSDERTGTREFEGEMFKRQGGSDRDGYFNVLSVNSGNATCPSLSTWFVCVGESCWCDLVE